MAAVGTDLAELKLPMGEIPSGVYGLVDDPNQFDLVPLVPVVTNFASPYWCGAGLNTVSIAHDGTVYPCQMFLGDPEFAMGNILCGNLLGQERFLLVQERLLKNKKDSECCVSCCARAICRGCIGYAWKTRRTINCRTDELCAYQVRVFQESMLFLLESLSDPCKWADLCTKVKLAVGR